MVARILRSLRLVVSGGEILRTDRGGHSYAAQIAGVAGETLDRVPILGPYGMAYRPPDGSAVVTAAVGADRSQLVILGAAHADDRAPELEPGEVALYGRGGSTVRLTLDGRVYITGNVEATGSVSDFRGSLELVRQLFDSHTHQTSTGPTGPPLFPMTAVGGSGESGESTEGAGEGDTESNLSRLTGPSLPAETGGLWYFDAALARAVHLPSGPAGTFAMSNGPGQPITFELVPPTTDATYLTTGVLEGGTP